MRLGLQTFSSPRGAKALNVDRIISFAEIAQERRCDLIAFPEFSVNGPWVTYDPSAKLEDLLTDAEAIPGPTTNFLQQEARRIGIALGVGIAELGLAEKPFNSYVIIDGSGTLHIQRKLQPTESEMPFYRGGGDNLDYMEIKGTKIGVTICADNENSAIHKHWQSLGVDLVLEPHYDCIKRFQEPGKSWGALLEFNRCSTLNRRVRHPSGRFGLVMAYVDAKDPRETFTDLPEWPHFVTGKSACYNSDGRLLAENSGNEETLLVINI